MKHDEFSFTRETLIEFLNNAKSNFLFGMVQEGVITDEQRQEAAKYVLELERPGNFGSFFSKVYDVSKSENGKEYFALMISRLIHKDIKYNEIDLPKTENVIPGNTEYIKECDCSFTVVQHYNRELTESNDDGDIVCAKCKKPWSIKK